MSNDYQSINEDLENMEETEDMSGSAAGKKGSCIKKCIFLSSEK